MGGYWARSWIAALGFAAASASAADEFTLGLGWDGVDSGDHGAVAGMLEYRSRLSLALGPVTLAPLAAAQIDADGDVWIGAGLFAGLDTGFHGLRVEASVAPGFYEQGGGQDLGGPFEIRSAIGVSLPVAEGWRLGVMGAHVSNAGVYDHNPGTEVVMATLTRRF
jgi:hypothetical protein